MLLAQEVYTGVWNSRLADARPQGWGTVAMLRLQPALPQVAARLLSPPNNTRSPDMVGSGGTDDQQEPISVPTRDYFGSSDSSLFSVIHWGLGKQMWGQDTTSAVAFLPQRLGAGTEGPLCLSLLVCIRCDGQLCLQLCLQKRAVPVVSWQCALSCSGKLVCHCRISAIRQRCDWLIFFCFDLVVCVLEEQRRENPSHLCCVV